MAVEICKGCKNITDPEVCHCGDAVDAHSMWSGHSPVPMGCTCGYETAPLDEVVPESILAQAESLPGQ